MSGEKVYVIGMGPGSEDYLVPLARRKIEEADVLVGSGRLTGLFPAKESHALDFAGEPPGTVRFILENRRRKVAVLVSGDPGLYSFLGVLARYLDAGEYEVIPGISSVQLAFARLGESWEDAAVRSIHGRDLEGLVDVVREHGKVALLTDGRLSPRDIAAHLIEGGIKDRDLVVCRNLSYPDEAVTRTGIGDAMTLTAEDGLYIVIIQEKRA